MRFIGVLVCALGLALADGAVAATAAPTLKARVDGATVVVQWSWTANVRRADAVLEIASQPAGGAWSTAHTVARPRRRGTWKDRPAPGDVAYRARLVVAGDPAVWSDAVSVTVGDTAPPPTSGPQPCPGDFAGQVRSLIDQARADAGVPALRAQSQLGAAAAARATTMATARVLSHDGWSAAIRAAGYTGGTIGENIAYGYGSAAAVFKGWMGSAGHRANILGAYFHDTGIGCRVDGRGVWWWSEEFGG